MYVIFQLLFLSEKLLAGFLESRRARVNMIVTLEIQVSGDVNLD
jgi:hypothetical protein